MDRKDPLLSHQYEAVSALANNFGNVTAVTGRVGNDTSEQNFDIVSTEWKPGNKLRNVYRLYLKALPIIVKGNFDSVFFHMTDLQCALLSPWVALRGKKQFLWYAHTYKSNYLVFSSFWVNGIVTSTSGSCPLSGPKVISIGQAIDEEKFRAINLEDLDLSKLIHIGRFDRSKNIQLLISAARQIRNIFPDLMLTLVGSPANAESKVWAHQLVTESQNDIQAGRLIFKSSIPRENFPLEVAENGCFFHAYIGSLDKTLIESTMLRVPVVTINPEYIEIFGTWGDPNSVDLVSEYVAMRTMSRLEMGFELDRRLDIARRNHSLKHWVGELTSLLR